MAKILVIDDSDTVATAVRVALTADGHVVQRLEFFVDLASLLRRNRPDLIILDLEMPGFSGARLGTFIREQCKSSVPVCLYSSRPLADIHDVARQINAVGALGKGRPIEELRRLVAEILGGAAEASKS